MDADNYREVARPKTRKRDSKARSKSLVKYEQNERLQLDNFELKNEDNLLTDKLF